MRSQLVFMWLPLMITVVMMVGRPSFSATDTLVYGGCSQLKFSPATEYESNLNALLTTLVSSASLNTYNNSTVSGSTKEDTIYGLFQCRGDLSSATCAACVSRAVAQLGRICLDACGGVLQLEGCFLRYDNRSFFGVEEKTLVVKNCGPSNGLVTQDTLAAVMGYLGSEGGDYRYRVGGSGDTQGVAQCVGDLSPSQCQDCLSDAISRLRSDCPTASSADVFLAKCYARYYSRGTNEPAGEAGNERSSGEDESVQKTLAIIIGLIAGVMLLVVFLPYIGKQCQKLQETECK